MTEAGKVLGCRSGNFGATGIALRRMARRACGFGKPLSKQVPTAERHGWTVLRPLSGLKREAFPYEHLRPDQWLPLGLHLGEDAAARRPPQLLARQAWASPCARRLRSYLRLQAGVGLPEEDLYLPGQNALASARPSAGHSTSRPRTRYEVLVLRTSARKYPWRSRMTSLWWERAQPG
jgi:hypothetical protein